VERCEKKQQRCPEHAEDAGDRWDHTAVAAESMLVVSLEAFGRRDPPPRHGATGRAARPVVRWPPGLASGQGHKHDKGSRVERVDVRGIHGKARLKHGLALLGEKQSNTRAVERHKGTSRLRNQRQGRKTVAFSTAPRSHRWMRWRSVGLYTFCHVHRSVRIKQETHISHRSPAMAAK
jgi:hypothetical protein